MNDLNNQVQEKPAKNMRIVIPADIHKQLKLASVVNDTTMADHVITILREALMTNQEEK